MGFKLICKEELTDVVCNIFCIKDSSQNSFSPQTSNIQPCFCPLPWSWRWVSWEPIFWEKVAFILKLQHRWRRSLSSVSGKLSSVRLSPENAKDEWTPCMYIWKGWEHKMGKWIKVWEAYIEPLGDIASVTSGQDDGIKLLDLAINKLSSIWCQVINCWNNLQMQKDAVQLNLQTKVLEVLQFCTRHNLSTCMRNGLPEISECIWSAP